MPFVDCMVVFRGGYSNCKGNVVVSLKSRYKESISIISGYLN